MNDLRHDLLHCLAAAELAYDPDPPAGIVRIEQGDSIALLLSHGQRPTLAFRGSEPTLGDWIDDLDFRWSPAAGNPGRVHRGFQRALDRVWRPLLGVLAGLGPRPLRITGHSLGGALATLATARLRRQGHPIDLLCTFGAPRGGDATFARTLRDQRTIRVATPGDAVCEAPPHGFGFRHAGELYLATEKELIRSPNPPRRAFEILRAHFAALAGSGPDALQSHRLACYRTRIEKTVPD